MIGPFGRAAERAGLTFDPEAIEQFEAFVALLSRHGKQANLVGTTDRDRIADEIVLDSARLAPLVTESVGGSGRLVDVGAGAGIPIIPLLIALPGWTGVAVEPREKRREFMKAARRELGMRDRMEIVGGRLEQGVRLPVEGHFALAVSKAVFEPDAWIEHAKMVVGRGAFVGVWLGASSKLTTPTLRREAYTTADGAEREIALVRIQ